MGFSQQEIERLSHDERNAPILAWICRDYVVNYWDSSTGKYKLLFLELKISNSETYAL